MDNKRLCRSASRYNKPNFFSLAQFRCRVTRIFFLHKKLKNNFISLHLFWWSAVISRHLLHFCPFWERDASLVSLLEDSVFVFPPVKRFFFFSFSSIQSRVKHRGCCALYRQILICVNEKYKYNLIDWFKKCRSVQYNCLVEGIKKSSPNSVMWFTFTRETFE